MIIPSHLQIFQYPFDLDVPHVGAVDEHYHEEEVGNWEDVEVEYEEELGGADCRGRGG
jgi:hypothetical protein